MAHIISKELIDSYLTRDIQVNKRRYRAIFAYTGVNIADCDQIEVGYTINNKDFTSYIYVPSLREDNHMLYANRNMWNSVSMVIPPLNHIDNNNKKQHAISIISKSFSAKKLTDFFPTFREQKPETITPLHASLLKSMENDNGVITYPSINDINKWIVIDIGTAIIEMFNMKIRADIIRTQSPGGKILSATISSIHTLIRAFLRYSGNPESEQYSETDSVCEEELFLGSINIADKKDVVISHPAIKDVELSSDIPIDLCTGNQSQPITTGRLKDGIEIDNCKFVGKIQFPYTRWRRSIVGITHDDPRRVIVSRSITRSLKLYEPDIPLSVTDVMMDIDSVSLPGVRMTHPLNYEDSIVISQTMANKMGAYKISVESFTVPNEVDIICRKKVTNNNILQNIKERSRSIVQNSEISENDTVIYPDETIATIVYKDNNDEQQIKDIKTKVVHPSIIIKKEEIETANDISEPGTVHRYVLLTFYPTIVGDKLSDMHGNKCTVGAILEDDKMPIWSSNGHNIRCHYIASPYIMKRLAIGAEIEDKLSLVGYCKEYQIEENSLDPISFDEADDLLKETIKETNIISDYTGSVEFDGKIMEDIPISMRRMVRLNNNASETMMAKAGVKIVNKRRVGNNIRLGLDIVTMLSRKANNIVNELIEYSGSKEYVNTYLIPILHALSSTLPENTNFFEVTEKLPGEIIGNPISYSKLKEYDLSGTTADSRFGEGFYGIIKYLGNTIIVPPHDPISDISNGSIIVSNISTAANRIVSEILSEKFVTNSGNYSKRMPNVERTIKRYYYALSCVIKGKDGLLRTSMLPVAPHSIRAVATPHVDSPDIVYLPRNAFKTLLNKSKIFKEVYGNSRFSKVIIKRDPVHSEKSLISMTFKLWDNMSIGLPPTVLGGLNADFDGDTVTAIFPISALSDIDRLSPNMEEMFSDSKQLVGTNHISAIHELKSRVGWTSTFLKPHHSDNLRNTSLYNILMHEYDKCSIEKEAIVAARDFEKIKDGTARCGALGLRYVYTRNINNTELLRGAMELYHVLAQNTLDSKSGVPTPSLDIVAAFSSGKSEIIQEKLSELGFDNQMVIDDFIEFSKTVGKNKINTFLNKNARVTAVLQNTCTLEDCLSLSKSTGTKTGIWEQLLYHMREEKGKLAFNPIMYMTK